MGKAARTSPRGANGSNLISTSTSHSTLYPPSSDPTSSSLPPRKGRGRPEGGNSLLGDLLDERRRTPLDEFRRRFVQLGEEGDGLRYALFHYLVAERYRALRGNSKRKFIEGPEHSHWPVPPEELSSSYMVMPVGAERTSESPMDVKKSKSQGGGGGTRREAKASPSMTDESAAIPLYQLLRPPRRRKTDHDRPPRQKSPADDATVNVSRYGLLEGDVVRETRAPPYPFVTMDQSYGLYMALTGTTEKLWSPCMEVWRRTYGGRDDKKEPKEPGERGGKDVSVDMEVGTGQDHHPKEQGPSMTTPAVLAAADEMEEDGAERSTVVLVTPALDPFLRRAVAEQVQDSLSATFDWCLDLLQWPLEGVPGSGRWPQYSLDAHNVLMAAERAKIPSWILTRVKGRLKHLFPPMPSLD